MIVGQFLEACASLPLFTGFSSRQHTIVPSGVEPMGEALLLSRGPCAAVHRLPRVNSLHRGEQLPLLLSWVEIMMKDHLHKGALWPGS